MGLIDEWALRFFHELDYKREAQNSILFAEQMSGLQGITVSEVFPQLSTRNVLTTAWVKGMLGKFFGTPLCRSRPSLRADVQTCSGCNRLAFRMLADWQTVHPAFEPIR